MHEKHLYEYAVVRVVPKVEREEFINVGLILFSKKQRFLKMKYHIPEDKIKSFCTEFDIEQMTINLSSFQKICEGNKAAGPIALLDTAERFRWLTAVKSSSIQTSRPHPGFSNDLEASFERLYQELVL